MHRETELVNVKGDEGKMLYAYVILFGALFACVILFYRRYTRRSQPFARSYSPTWTALGVLLIVLSGCGTGGAAPSQTNAQPTATPAAATPTRAPSLTPNTTKPNVNDWTSYYYDPARSGYRQQLADPTRLTNAWSKSLDGAVYASPLSINGHVIVATEGNSLYSFDAQTGKQLWRTNVGQPVPRSTLPCGNIDPLGITGTPVYDPASKLVFAVAEVTGPSHILVGVDVDSGKVKVRRSVDTADMNPAVHQQRAALALNQGMIYIAYGGLYGDCGNYLGRVIAARTSGQGALLSYVLPTTREGGIWAPPGPVMDDKGRLYVSVGNGEQTGSQWDHTDSVLRLSPTLQLEDGFAPRQWAQDNAADADLGSMSPVLLSNGLIYISGKSGQGYLLRANALGGVGGQIQETYVCRSYGGGATTGTEIFLPCTDGVRQVKIGPGETMSVGWHTQAQINGTPVIGGRTLYVVDRNGGVLYALNRDNGNVRASIAIGETSRFATPALANGLIFIGTLKGIVAVK